MAVNSHDGIHASYFLGFRKCPNCNEEVFAAEGATHVPEGVRFDWCCDLCGHKFETAENDNASAA
jgi:hypothetical protein